MSPSPRGRWLPGRSLNAQLSASVGHEVVMIETLSVAPGDVVTVRFDRASPIRRQGVWLATEGVLRVAEDEEQQFVVWSDTAPTVFEVTVLATDGLLRFYNVWKPDRGAGRFESNSYTSGMLRRESDGGWIEYSCSDFGLEPAFDRLVFSILPPRRGFI